MHAHGGRRRGPRASTTDAFGDFWFNGLEVGTYALSIEADGFAAKAFDAVDAAEDVNLGDIALSS